MDERERVIREIIKVLPELAKSLNRDVAAHAAMMHVGAGSASPGSASPRSASHGSASAGSTPGVSTAQLRALVHLAQYGPQTMGELAEGLQITTASATGLVNPLVEMGHVTRSRDADDRRVVRIGLSERAERLAKDIIAERRREVEVALDGMDLQACRSFLEGLERLAGHTTRRKAEVDK